MNFNELLISEINNYLIDNNISKEDFAKMSEIKIDDLNNL